MSFPGYAKYKSSGVPWLGDVPAHWTLLRLKQISPSITVGIVVNPSDYVTEEGLPFIYGGDITEGKINVSGARRISASASASQPKTRLRAGDLVTVRVGAPGVTAVVPPECEGGNCASVMLIRRGAFHSQWLCYALNSRLARYQVELVQYGAAQEQFNISHAVDFVIPTPSPDEQRDIARFLDRETAKIDGLVEEQKRLIELLKEKRQAVISHAVTEGLDPNAPVKDSGLDWLGQVPEHWRLLRMKDVCSEIVDCKNRTPDEVPDEPYFVVRTSCVREGKFDPSGGYFTNAKSFKEWTRKGQPKIGDVLFTREAPAGEACLAPEGFELCLGQRMMYLRPDPSTISSEFVLLTIYGPLVRSYIEAKSKGSTVGHLRVGEVGELPCLLPPLDEQLAISEHLNDFDRQYAGLVDGCETNIELLQERRSALISAAVTGKIDVREKGQIEAEAA
jgi:type I restriction enzyme S subunit